MVTRSYTEDNISSLSQVEALRYRPTVYIGELGTTGMFHLLKEVVTNSVDEFIGGYGKEVCVSIDTKTDKRGPRFTVEDYGRGMPHGKIEDMVAKLNTSGKYGDISGKSSGGYGTSAGLIN